MKRIFAVIAAVCLIGVCSAHAASPAPGTHALVRDNVWVHILDKKVRSSNAEFGTSGHDGDMCALQLGARLTVLKVEDKRITLLYLTEQPASRILCPSGVTFAVAEPAFTSFAKLSNSYSYEACVKYMRSHGMTEQKLGYNRFIERFLGCESGEDTELARKAIDAF